jgi:hypothetical protein
VDVSSLKSEIRKKESKLMELIKKNKIVIAIVLIVLVLIFIRSTGKYHFKNDAKRWAGASVNQSNKITIMQAGSLTGKYLVINLDKDVSQVRELTSDALNVPADSILSKDHITMIMKHAGPVLLFSSEPGLSARIWMILSQMGHRNIYILTKNADNEVFKYKFLPDTLSGTKL